MSLPSTAVMKEQRFNSNWVQILQSSPSSLSMTACEPLPHTHTISIRQHPLGQSRHSRTPELDPSTNSFTTPYPTPNITSGHYLGIPLITPSNKSLSVTPPTTTTPPSSLAISWNPQTCPPSSLSSLIWPNLHQPMHGSKPS